MRPALDSRQRVVLFVRVVAEFRDGVRVCEARVGTAHALRQYRPIVVFRAHLRMAENTQAGVLRPREKLCYNPMSCAQFLNPAIEIFGGFHAAAPASAR